MSNIGLTEWECREIAEETLKMSELEPKFGNLSNAQRERLEMLAEEAAEVVQVCTKILRHGYGSYHPDDPGTRNKSLLMKELLDLWTVYERMADYGDLAPINFYGSAQVWAGKLKWTHHQPEFNHPTLPRQKPQDGTAVD